MSMLAMGQQERWALISMESGENVVEFQSFISAEIVDEGKVVSAQLEEGSFASYNKTENPLEVKVTLGMQGTDSDLQTAIEKLEELRKGLDLIGLDTPVITYADLTLERFTYQLKRENGRGVLFADLSLVEIIQVEAKYTDVKLAPENNRGKVQAKQPQGQQAAQGGNAGNERFKKYDSLASRI